MGKGFLQTMAELLAGAAPDSTAAALQGNLKVIFSGSQKECFALQQNLLKSGKSASIVATNEIGEYMVTVKGLW